MANIDNECKDLEVKDFYAESTTHLEDIMSHQKTCKKKLMVLTLKKCHYEK